MDEELQKRNTDCVYFLASPLTCKKGVECEYRHSEIARLNPRDCWYWFTGSCLNPTCAFRHPPIENRAEASSESALPPQHKSAVPVVTKTNVSCYFYFNGYCNKGERCLFLHGPDDGAWKSSKIAPSGVPDGPKTEKKTSAGGETGPAPTEKHPNSSEARPEAEANHYSLTNKVGEQSASPEISEEAIAEGFTEGGESHLSSDGTEAEEEEEEEMEDNVARDDWLESSPGFDVLVEDERLQGLSPEDDHEYLLHNDMVEDYGFEDSLEYDPPAYQDIRIMSDEELDDSYCHVVKRDINEYVGEIQSVPRKRKFPEERGNVDLRDLLTKRRAIENSHPIHLSSTRFDLSRLNYHKDRHGSRGSQWVPRKLASKVESLDNHRGRFRESQESINKQHSKDRRMRMASRKRSSEVPKIFSGPKTLHQIREEKGKGRQDGKLSRGSEREDFLGPKPLSEILKRKKRLGSAVNLRESENLGV